MRRLYLIGLLAASLVCVTSGTRGQSNTGANLAPQLQLTTEVVEARFCESDYLRLKLRLRYLNTGKQPLILYRQSNLIMTYFISKSISDAKLEKYEQKFSPLQSLIGPPQVVDNEEPDEQTFVILDPASYYEVIAQADLPFIYDGKSEDSDQLRPGPHVLQIRAQTWPVPQDAAVKLRERWATHGFLWTKSVVSQPMTFSIAKPSQVVRCSK